MVELLIGCLAGGIISWAITHWYYKKSSVNIPDWAKPLIQKLPQIPPNYEELLRLFQEEITKGNIKPHPIFGYVACPNCNAKMDELKQKVVGDDYNQILDLSCPHCGWSEWTQI